MNKVIYSKTKFVTRNNSSIVDIGAISINKFASGIYNLIVSVSDTLADVSASSIKRVYVYNPDIIDSTQISLENVDLLATELSVLGEQELDLMYEQSKYIATEQEKSEWGKIVTVEGKRTFINNFWKIRDNNPSTPLNEVKREYFRRVDYANQQYGNFARKEGWRSDFGRVYIMYGDPYEIDRHPNELDVKPYEIWFYSDIEGGVIFVFADESGFGEYRLIHSDKQGELQNYEWLSTISAQ